MRASGGAADRLLPHSAHRSIRAGPWPPPADGALPARYLQGTLLDFGGRFALEPPRGNQHRQAARARLATEKPAVLRRHMPVWTVREAAACGLTEAERAAIVGRSRRFGLSGRAGISSKCEIQLYSALHSTSSTPSLRYGVAVTFLPHKGGAVPESEKRRAAWRTTEPSHTRVPTGPKKEKKKEMGHPRSQHFVLESRDIESVTRREGRWGFSKVYPWNGRIQP